MREYDESILKKIKQLQFAAQCKLSPKSAAVNLKCGCIVVADIEIKEANNTLYCSYKTNGCPYMIFAAEAAAACLSGRQTADLMGDPAAFIRQAVYRDTGLIPDCRTDCIEAVIESFIHALAALRNKRIGETSSTSMLICSCFGISQETIVDYLHKNPKVDLSDIVKDCRAGSGCGSCRMTILEIIEEVHSETR